MHQITYVSDQAGDYIAGLSKCKTLAELEAHVADFQPIAADACSALPRNAAEFAVFRAGLRKERRRQYAGDEFCERFGPVLLPAVLLHVGLLAQQFNAPWGCAYIRARELGLLVEEEGTSIWKGKT